MDSLTLALLGAPRIERNGAPLPVDRQKSIALLVYLALNDGAQPRERLAALLWPDAAPSLARTSLRGAIFALEQALGTGWLIRTGDAVALRQGPALWLDVQQFRARLARCLRAGGPAGRRLTEPATGNTNVEDGAGDPLPDERCLTALREAAALYRDDFLAGFRVRDAEPFEEWQAAQVETLRGEVGQTLARLADLCAARSEHERAIAYARRWLALDPLHEPAHRRLMQLYADSGQPATAARQYQECAAILAAELGVAPAAETQRLLQTLGVAPALQSPARRAPRSAESGRLRLAPLPRPSSPFIGREVELAWLAQQLAAPDCRLVTLTGFGGVGKTRLAIEAAERAAVGFRDGVCFVSLAATDAEALLAPVIAEALGMALAGKEPPERQLIDRLRGRELLLLLDNAEHLLGGVALLQRILEAAPGVTLLVTARERLGLRGEALLAVAGLPAPKADEPVSAQHSAVRLFLQSAARARADFDPGPAERAAVGRICRLVEGMPLALELGATWVTLLSCAEIAAEIERGLSFLSDSFRDLPARHRSLQAVFDHSWTLLPESGRGALARLAVFRGGFDRAAAVAVGEAGLGALRPLVEASLLRRDAAGRYALLEVVRQFAEGRLALDLAAEEQTRDRHAAFYAALLAGWQDALRAPRQREALAAIAGEIENVRAAWRWLAQRRALDQLDTCAESLFRFYQTRSSYREGEAAFSLLATALVEPEGGVIEPATGAREMAGDVTASAARDSLPGDAIARPSPPMAVAADAGRERDRLLGETLARQGWFSLALGQTEAAADQLARALALLPADRAPRQRAAACAYLGDLARSAQRYGVARARLEESLALFEREGDAWGTAQATIQSGVVALDLGEHDAAERHFRRSLTLTRGLGDERGVARSLANLGMVNLARGAYDEAHRLYEQALQIFRALEDQWGIALALNNQGVIAYSERRYAAAGALHEQSLAIKRAIGDRRGLALALVNLGDIMTHLGEHARAESLLTEALALCRELDDTANAARSLGNLGVVARALGDDQRVWRSFVEAIRLAQRTGSTPLLLDMLVGIGALLPAYHDPARALRIARSAAAHAAAEEEVKDRARRIIAALETAAGARPSGDIAGDEQAPQELAALVALIDDALIDVAAKGPITTSRAAAR